MSTTIATVEYSSSASQHSYELPARDLQDLHPTPPIDRDQLLDQCLGNWDFALMLLDEFAKTSASRLDAFDAALIAQDSATIAAKAHALKGTAGILAAKSLMETCSKLESSAKEEDWRLSQNLVQQLRYEIQRTIGFIPDLRAMA